MGLDVGEKTIGVAVSDELGIVATPLTTIMRTASIKADLRQVEQLIQIEDISTVVVGLPIMLDGEEAVQAGKVREFAERLARRLRIPLEMWDERLSTVEAHRALRETGAKREKRKRVVDAVAAAIILRSYLNAKEELH
jgi:putative Holliday junction resolvase